MRVSKGGNSLAVRLPKALVDELQLDPGDELNVVAASKKEIAVKNATGVQAVQSDEAIPVRVAA